ncbi:WD40-repeat-containing domain protein [Xylariales sp. PMI_506]|nr:WD40-repeat-containing domain protein [Xylariales sp. PMI_506]
MQKGVHPDHFFETDATAARRQRQTEKAGNKNGNPITLKAKPLAAIRDPTTPLSLLVAESSGSTQESNNVYRGPSAPVTCVTVGGPGNKTIFAGSWDKDIWSWDIATKAPGRRYSGHSDFVKSVVCTKIGGKDILISGGADKKIMVWDIATGARLHVLQDQTVSMMAIQDLVIDPVQSGEDEAILVSASSDPHIRRWRIRLDLSEQLTESSPEDPGSSRHTILEHETTVYKLVFDHDVEELDLWTSSGDGTAKCLSRLKGFTPDDTIEHGDHVRAVALTEQWIITAGRDEDVKVWDRATGKLYCSLVGHFDEITDLVILSGSAGAGNQVASVSLDGTIRTWPLAKTQLDLVIREQEEQAKGVEKEATEDVPESLMTADEEAELAALMDED